jgi:hypothetical protein
MPQIVAEVLGLDAQNTCQQKRYVACESAHVRTLKASPFGEGDGGGLCMMSDEHDVVCCKSSAFP